MKRFYATSALIGGITAAVMILWALAAHAAVGPTALNVKMYTMTAVDGNTISLGGVDGSALPDWSSGGTYKLADTQAARDATGFVYGVDHWAFTDVGAPKVITRATILANGSGPNIWANADQVTILA